MYFIESIHIFRRTLLTLDLNHNQFDKIPSALQDIEVLHTFIINDNPIVNISDENKFPRMSKLKVLSISNMPKLEEIGGKTLSGLQAIEQLHIKNNPKLNKIHNDAFVSSTKVRREKTSNYNITYRQCLIRLGGTKDLATIEDSQFVR